MEKRYVIFLSPGTFVSETNKVEVPSWDVEAAVEMARTVKQRHGATPYGFYFETWEKGEWEPKKTKTSNMYYLGGKVMTYDEVPDIAENRILRSNMHINGYERVIENTNSYKVTFPLQKNDIVLKFSA